MMMTSRKVYFQRDHSNRRIMTSTQPAVQMVPTGRIPRVTRLVALAIHFDRLIRDGAIDDQSELARLCRITQPRATQIMNLLHLAPDIIEELLHLPRTTAGRDPINERLLRPVAAVSDWSRQRVMWKNLRST
jgi:hypothetical protein